MTSVSAQIQALQAALLEEQRRSRRNRRSLMLIYALLVGGLVWQSSLIIGQIKQLTAPEHLARLASQQLGRDMPKVQEQIVAHLQMAAPDIAKRLVNAGHQTLGETGQTLKKQLRSANADLQDRVARRLPLLESRIKAHLQQAGASGHYPADARLNQYLVGITVQALEPEVYQAFSPTLFYRLAGIKRDVDQLLGKPAAALPVKLRAEKAVLLNALRLSELSRVKQGNSVLADSLRALLDASLPTDLLAALEKPVSP